MAERGAAVAVALLTLVASNGQAATAYDRTLDLPRPLEVGETAWIVVQVGAIGRGQEIDVTTGNGQDLGTISPFGVRAGQDAGTYTLPLPSEAIRKGRVTIHLTISQPGAPPRPPTTQEVRTLTLKIAPARP